MHFRAGSACKGVDSQESMYFIRWIRFPFDAPAQNDLKSNMSLQSLFPSDLKVINEDAEKILSHGSIPLISFESYPRFIIFISVASPFSIS
jgi:hypothetical protein